MKILESSAWSWLWEVNDEIIFRDLEVKKIKKKPKISNRKKENLKRKLFKETREILLGR